jgi:hypothetical protein
MFDSLPDAEDEDGAQTDEGPEGSGGGILRAPHIPAVVAFCLLYFPLKSYAWSCYLAVGTAFTLFVFWFALGSRLNDLDDFFGDSAVPKYAAKLLIPHSVVLGLVLVRVFSWFHLKPELPEWVTYEGRKGSFWEFLGWLSLLAAAFAEGFWMAGKVKRRFEATED